MKALWNKAARSGAKLVRLCSNRFLILALVFALAAGTLLSTPIFAAEEETVPAEPALPAEVAVCTVKLLQSNLQALETATLPSTTVYTGTPLQMHSVTVVADGKSVVLCLEAGKTVKEAVMAAGVQLGAEDYFTVPGERFVQDGLTVTIVRVAYTEYTKTYKIAYTTEVKYTSTLRQGTSKVEQAGVAGVKAVTYRDRTENGKAISTVQVKSVVTKQPVKKIILKGTKVGKIVSEAPFDVPLDSAGQPLNYSKKLTGKATAYTSDRGDSGLYTSCGYRTNVGIVAVNPKVIPYGTKLWIVSADGKYVYGYAIAGDTGGGVRSGKLLVDLYFNTYGECLQFGRRTMNVYFLK